MKSKLAGISLCYSGWKDTFLCWLKGKTYILKKLAKAQTEHDSDKC